MTKEKIETQTGANDTAMPFVCDEYLSGGLTKRELFAMAAMQGLLAGTSWTLQDFAEGLVQQRAVVAADKLLEELAK